MLKSNLNRLAQFNSKLTSFNKSIEIIKKQAASSFRTII